jgi:gliding motility-associated-like protein
LDNLKYYRLILFFLLVCNGLSAQSYLEFVENKGQWHQDIQFKASAGPVKLVLARDGYRVHQYNPKQYADWGESMHRHGVSDPVLRKQDGAVKLESHAWFVSFVGSNPEPQVIPEKPLPTYNNYFLGNDPSRWKSNCKIYNGVTYKNIYPGIDIKYYTGGGTLKYDIIVHPGANPAQLRLQYRGIEKLRMRNKKLIVSTSVGEIVESIPLSYQVGQQGRKMVDVNFRVYGNMVNFELGDYDRSKTLVIDPTVVFCSFTGSSGDNWGFTATYGQDGSLYSGAMVRESGFPVSPGAYDGTYNGGDPQNNGGDESDIGIFKFSSNGSSRLYATYLGGPNDDQVHSIIADANNNLILAGRTRSGGGFPSTLTLGPLGGYDIVIAKLNAAGTALMGSVRIGGTGTDGVNIKTGRTGNQSLEQNYGDDGRSEVNLDVNGNILVASCTQSNDFFTTAGAFQTTSGGNQDGVVIKMNPTLTSALFSTYFGGNNNDAAYVVSVDKSTNNIYVAGGTESNNLPGDKTGVLQQNNAGGIDGFLTIFTPAGANVKTTYIGTSGTDQTYGVQFDRNNFPYITGTTTGNWPVQNAVYSNAGGKQYICKVRQDLSGYVYSTRFGTGEANPNISPIAFLVDQCENVYVAGWGGDIVNGYFSAGTSGLPITPDAIQATTDDRDIYFFVLEKDATSQLFGSFFGVNMNTNAGYLTDHVDGGTSRFDPRGAVYIAICACSQNNGAAYPVTAGSWAISKPPRANGTFPLCNLAALKLSFNLGGVDGDVKVSDTTGCMPLTVNFRDDIDNAVTWDFDFGDGTFVLNSPTPNVSHTYSTPGFFRARMIAVDLTSCNLRDTSYVNIRVRNDRAVLNFNGVKQPPCENLTYVFNNTSVAPPGKPFSNTSFQWDFGDGSPLVTAGTAPQTKTYANAGSYTVRLILTDTNYCNAPDTFRRTFNLSPAVDARFTVPNGCAPYQAEFENNSLAGATYEWTFGDGGTSTAFEPTHLYANPGTYTVTLVVNDPATCNLTDTMRYTLTVHPTPVADFSFSPNPAQENIPTQFANLSTVATIFNWNFGDGETSAEVNPLHQFNTTDTFNVCLIASTVNGCADTICYDVPAIVLPLMDVSNAFTPNGDGRNDRIFVRGFGIKNMRWRIYNRFGQLVFETSNKNTGWDGTFKGVLQPMDAYAYTLEVELVDGKRIRKQGDITLIR